MENVALERLVEGLSHPHDWAAAAVGVGAGAVVAELAGLPPGVALVAGGSIAVAVSKAWRRALRRPSLRRRADALSAILDRYAYADLSARLAREQAMLDQGVIDPAEFEEQLDGLLAEVRALPVQGGPGAGGPHDGPVPVPTTRERLRGSP